MHLEEVYTVEDIAEKLKLSDRYVRDKISDKGLKAYKRGKRFYILHSDLIEFIKSGSAT